MEQKKVIGITMGDPGSIGPEIAAKALGNSAVYERVRPLVIGDAWVMEEALDLVGRRDLTVHPVESVGECVFQPGIIDVYDLKIVDKGKLERGKVSKLSGEAAFRYVETVIRLAMAGEVDATVTNALNKEALNLAGHHYSGHTEIYADMTDTKSYTMLLVHENLRVVHVSTHVSLRQACDLVKKERILEVIRIADQACRQMGLSGPRIGVAGLNPHSGENGLFGKEEIEQIEPAVRAARALGINAEGPVPPDSLFSKARGGWYDIVVAMYHDQGHIPLKVVGFVYSWERGQWQEVSGVNITLGLPIIRTSVDHGTAFDQAGKGTASEISLLNAIEYAALLAENR